MNARQASLPAEPCTGCLAATAAMGAAVDVLAGAAGLGAGAGLAAGAAGSGAAGRASAAAAAGKAELGCCLAAAVASFSFFFFLEFTALAVIAISPRDWSPYNGSTARFPPNVILIAASISCYIFRST